MENVVVGIEILAYHDVVGGCQSYLAFFPQLHWQINVETIFQFGPGTSALNLFLLLLLSKSLVFKKMLELEFWPLKRINLWIISSLSGSNRAFKYICTITFLH